MDMSRNKNINESLKHAYMADAYMWQRKCASQNTI